MSETEIQPARIEIEGSGGMVLRQLVEADAQTYFGLIDQDRPHLSQHDDITARKYQTVEDVLESIQNPKNPDKLRFGIWVGGVMVGSINVQPEGDDMIELGYWIGSQHIGHGYAAEATKALTPFVFEAHKPKFIFGRVHKNNEASKRTLEKAGFVPDETRPTVYRLYPSSTDSN